MPTDPPPAPYSANIVYRNRQKQREIPLGSSEEAPIELAHQAGRVFVYHYAD